MGGFTQEKDIFGVPSGLSKWTWNQCAGQGNREAVKLPKLVDTHMLVTQTACVLFI